MRTCVLKYRMATFSSEDNETFSLDSIIRGHHVYKLHWIPVLGQELEVQAEPDNTHDPRAVATCLDGNVVGHLPIEFSRVGMALSQPWRSNLMCSYWPKKVF